MKSAGPISRPKRDYADAGNVPLVVLIELYGVARLRAGRETFEVEGKTLSDALHALGSACPSLVPSVVTQGALGSSFLVALNGAQITADPTTKLKDGDVVVLLSADAGG